MKYSTPLCKTALLFLALFITHLTAFGQHYIPPFGNKGFHLEANGFGQAIWSDRDIDGDIHNRNAKFLSLITRLQLTTPNPAIKFFGRMELLGIDDREANWLKRFYLEADLTSQLTLRVGRMHLSGARTIPMSEDLETVREPRIPWSRNGNGIQLEAKLGDGWKVLADVTGDTSFNFDDDCMYRRTETSLRLSRSWHNGDLILAGQLGTIADTKTFGLDFKWKATKQLYLRGAVYSIDDDLKRGKGGILFVGYSFLDTFELHSQIDYRDIDKKSSDTIWTNGVRIWLPKRRVEVTLDHESIFPYHGPPEQRFYGRLEIPF